MTLQKVKNMECRNRWFQKQIKISDSQCRRQSIRSRGAKVFFYWF